jgi:hypothetical protein
VSGNGSALARHDEFTVMNAIIREQCNQTGKRPRDWMHMASGRRKWSVATAVFVGHALLLLLVDQVMREEPIGQTESRRTMLFFVRPPQRPPRIPIEASRLNEAARPTLPKTRAPEVPPLDVQAVPGTSTPKIDRLGEATEAASNAIRAQQAADALKFSEESKRPRKKCVKPHAPEWRPEGPTYGFTHGLPFVQFADGRCMFALIFIGCGFGAKPQADSHLFDNMHNYPNDSSVPELDECEESH